MQYSFAPGRQKGTVTFSCLDPAEEGMIMDIVNRHEPERFIPDIYDYAGRSLILRSPTRNYDDQDYIWGRFDGLQLIGAGGSMQTLSNGLVRMPANVYIMPVDPANYAERLHDILELREFDEEGRLMTTFREYAPGHGMDRQEADRRADITCQLQTITDHVHGQGKKTYFIGPQLALDGYLDIADPRGDALRFQVYRVPLKPRLPMQLFERIMENPGSCGLEDLFFRIGSVYRSMHRMELAYMDGHLGNMCYLKDRKDSRIYITDLGSTRNISSDRHATKYMGFDIWTFINCIHLMGDSIGEMTNDKKGFARDFNNLAISSMLYGYFCNKHLLKDSRIIGRMAQEFDLRGIMPVDIFISYFEEVHKKYSPALQHQ